VRDQRETGMGRLEGKVALITGAGDGMGREAARRFAREGAKVGVLDVVEESAVQTVRQIEKEGGSALAVVADVSTPADGVRAVDRVVGAFGGLHVLYNNAGIWAPGDGAVTELTLDAWERTLRVNLTGAMLMCRAGIPALIDSGGGSIINTSSPVAYRPEPVCDAYTASKGGISALTRSIAQYYARHAIRANVLIPGPMVTGMTRDALSDPRYRDASIRMTVLGRLGELEEVASVALFLASDDSRFVTGSEQWVDGGWMLGPTQEPIPPA